MHSTNLLLEEPIRMVSILEPSKPNFFPAMTKIVGTLGPKSRSVEAISACLKAGMSVARFDFSWGDAAYHQETLENLKIAIKATKKLCAVMLDTVGPELQVVNKSEVTISLEENESVVLTPHQGQEASSKLLPINFSGLAKAVKPGATIFVGQYLFTGSETTSVWLEVSEVQGDDVVCVIKNSATLAGSLFTLHCSQIHIDMPTLSDEDKDVMKKWGAPNKIDFLSLSYTRHAEDVRQAREFLSKLGDLSQTLIFAKIENVEGLNHFDEILEEADGIILSRGNLGIDLPPEKVFLFQKSALHKCNMAGKPAVVTRVVDSMTDNLRPTRAEATDVANAVLDGSDAILLGAETLRGLYPVETISTVGRICAEAEKVFNQDLYFKRTVKYVGEPMTHLESIASSAVRAAIKVKASVIICFTSSGRAARLIAKYRPTMPVLSVVIPRLKTNQLKWSFTGAPAHRLGRVAPAYAAPPTRPRPRLRWTAAPLRQAGTPPLSARLRCTSTGACWSSSPTRSTLAAPLLQEMAGRYNRANYSSYLNDEPMPDATSEKEQGNEYFKQKKFAEAIECYSRSIALSPTAVAFANRAMAYLKLRRFEEAENDCTEALNLDDRYVKAYSRRITARRGLGKLKEAMDDAEFAVSVDANNPELRKQYSEVKALLMEKMAKGSSVQAKHTISEFDKAGDKKDITSHPPSVPQKDSFMEVDSPGRATTGIRELSGGVSKGGSGVSLKDNDMQQSRDARQRPGPEISVQELASRAASRYMSSTVKSVKTPKTAYDFEVSWRAISDDLTQQIQLLKSISPERLPEIFKDALSSAFLIDIVKCTASIFRDDAVLAVSILENLAKVSRFDLIVMCLSPMHKSELRKIWGQTFLAETASPDQVEALRRLQAKYVQGGWHDEMFTLS